MPTAFMRPSCPVLAQAGFVAAQATVRVRWNDGRGTKLPCGLRARGGHGLPPATAPSIMPELAGRELQGGPCAAWWRGRGRARCVGVAPPERGVGLRLPSAVVGLPLPSPVRRVALTSAVRGCPLHRLRRSLPRCAGEDQWPLPPFGHGLNRAALLPSPRSPRCVPTRASPSRSCPATASGRRSCRPASRCCDAAVARGRRLRACTSTGTRPAPRSIATPATRCRPRRSTPARARRRHPARRHGPAACPLSRRHRDRAAARPALRASASTPACGRCGRCPACRRVLADPRAGDIDLVIVRELTEGLFSSRGKGVIEDDREARDTLVITRGVCERLFDFSFRLAESRNTRRPARARHLRRQGERVQVLRLLPQGLRRARAAASPASRPTTSTSTRPRCSWCCGPGTSTCS